VVTTTTQLADFAHVIGGGHVTVYGVLKANVDPHDYEATPADIEAIGTAGVILKNGIGLEKWFEPAIKSAAPKGRIVDASAGADIHKDDPHVWHDPRNAKVMVRNLTDAFAAADAANAAAYRSAEAAYDKELDALDAENAAKINALADKKLVTNHDAFGYYVARYGLDLVGEVIPSFDTQAELSASEVSALVAKIKAEHVKAVFSESSLPPKTAAAIAREAGVKVVQGDDALYGDTLGPAGSDGDTYLKMERHNTRVIVANLG
jgi:zinc/manganese transport system substrate-binding protein/manganese/iron transport system substrate-binding protein